MMDIVDPTGEEAKQKLLKQARRLASGLERISADSRWARRSSGYRGALLKQLDRIENEPGLAGTRLETLEEIMAAGYDLLVKAAREIRVDQELLSKPRP